MLDLKSLTITRNNQGPKYVPWGTPARTVSQLEKQSEFNFTLWLLSLKNSIIQFTTVGFTYHEKKILRDLNNIKIVYK